jgi:hypothetical protein
MTRWSPDTCGCVIEYDDQVRVTAVVKKCTKHAGTKDDATHLETVLAHNRRKNAALDAITSHIKGLGIDPASLPLSVFYNDADVLTISGSGLSGIPALSGSAFKFVN